MKNLIFLILILTFIACNSQKPIIQLINSEYIKANPRFVNTNMGNSIIATRKNIIKKYYRNNKIKDSVIIIENIRYSSSTIGSYEIDSFLIEEGKIVDAISFLSEVGKIEKGEIKYYTDDIHTIDTIVKIIKHKDFHKIDLLSQSREALTDFTSKTSIMVIENKKLLYFKQFPTFIIPIEYPPLPYKN